MTEIPLRTSGAEGAGAERASGYPYRVEMGICAVLMAVFAFMFIHAGQWPLETALFPRLISIFGFAATLTYLIQLIAESRGKKLAATRRILDVPWAKVTGDAAAIKRTALGVVASVALFWVGIVLVGFHVAAPLYLFSQLKVYGKTRTWTAALGAAAIFLVIVLVYDELAGTTWNDPLLWDWVGPLINRQQ